MKKLFLGIVGFLVVVVLGAYLLLFTSFGNNILKPVVESKIEKALGFDVNVSTFRLRPSSVKLVVLKGKDKFVYVDGTFSIFAKSFDVDYEVNIPQLSWFSKLARKQLSGYFRTQGKVKGRLDEFAVTGKAFTAGGFADYSLKVVGRHPGSLVLNVKDLDLVQLLSMAGKPAYVKGKLFVKADFDSVDLNNMKGTVSVYTKDGATVPQILEKEFGFKDARVSFKLDSKAVVENSVAHVVAKLSSSVADFDLFDTEVQIKKATALGKYVLNIPDLDKLYFATGNHMRGSLKITGDFKKDKHLVVNAHSDTMDGKVDVRMVDDVVSGTLKGLRVVKVLETMMYPKFFDSKADADFKFNLTTKKGSLNAKLIDGHFLPTRFSLLIRTLAHFDITREVYKVSTLNSTISGDDIYSDLYMKSKLTEITGKKVYFNKKSKQVDANLVLSIKGRPLYVHVYGPVQKPKVEVDVKEFFKKKLEGEIKDRLKGVPSKKELFKNFLGH